MSQDRNNQNENQENDKYQDEYEQSSQYSRLGSLQPDYFTSSQYDDLQNSSSQNWYSQSDSYRTEDNVTASQYDDWQNSAARNWFSQPNSQDSFWASSQQSGISRLYFLLLFII